MTTHMSTHSHSFSSFRFPVLTLLAVLAACSTPGDQVAKAPAPSPAVTSPVPATAVRQVGPVSRANHIEDYKREVAAWVSVHNNRDVYSSQPQALLRGVVVLSINVDSDGVVQGVRVLRGSGDREVEQRAVQSVWRASPLPRPNRAVINGQATLNFSETWLFNNDGRFQLRSIALAQKTTNF
ncbi:MAG: energy transducer TonB [Burkholderiaceae bacterium]|nr:MAG: energy transducer TonB [Burkholderiaceae bacterium]